MLEAAWPLARDAALRGAVAGFGRCASKMRLSMLFEAVDTLTAEYRRIGDGTLAASAPCLVTALPEDLLVHIVQFFDDDKWRNQRGIRLASRELRAIPLRRLNERDLTSGSLQKP